MTLDGVSTPVAHAAMQQAIGAGLQADTGRALQALRGAPAKEFAGEDATYRACMLERFGAIEQREPSDVANELAHAVVAAYRSYWWHALRTPSDAKSKGAELLQMLCEVLGVNAESMEVLEPMLLERLGDAGFGAILGVTSPLRELMMWESQEMRTYVVELPEGAHTTHVEVLDRFVSLGWADYATCGRRGAGGWATPGALYAVRPRYSSLDDEEFHVTFLGHETQHLADLRRFQRLEPWELELRAKLVELALADATRPRILQKFTEDQGDDIASPHSYANRRVLGMLHERLGADLADVPTAALREAAREALVEDSEYRLREDRSAAYNAPGRVIS